MDVLRPGAQGRPAGARRSRRRADLGVGAGDAGPGRQHALQRTPPDDLHQQPRRLAGQHRSALVHLPARGAHALAPGGDVRLGGDAGRGRPRGRAARLAGFHSALAEAVAGLARQPAADRRDCRRRARTWPARACAKAPPSCPGRAAGPAPRASRRAPAPGTICAQAPKCHNGLYIHIPFCAAICNYCNFNRGLLDEALKRQLRRGARRRDPSRAGSRRRDRHDLLRRRHAVAAVGRRSCPRSCAPAARRFAVQPQCGDHARGQSRDGDRRDARRLPGGRRQPHQLRGAVVPRRGTDAPRAACTRPTPRGRRCGWRGAPASTTSAST